MCGISGIVDLAGHREIQRDVLVRMNDSMIHRGPDGHGVHFEPGVGFGHRRLSIIDLASGKQPLFNEDETVVVTYNGEIYNFHELEQELKALGHVFRTRCDTEVIVHAWEEWGTRCLERFNGMFAFALWDRNKQQLFLVRDRLGIKPLYYTVTESNHLLFASELKGLLKNPETPREIDPRAVEDYFAFGYIPDPRTIYRNVYKLEPGCLILVDKNKKNPVRQERYWDVPLDQPASIFDEEEAKEFILSGLNAAVDRRLVADVPLGAFLSGGIDSSAVVAMMAAQTDDVLTCSIGFSEPRYDESKFADVVADQYKTNHKKEMVESSDYSLLDQLIDVYDEPYSDSSAIPTYRVCELARKHVTVALSGDGGDENFIGYRRYSFFSMEDKLRSMIPQSVRGPIFGVLGKAYPKLDWAPRFVRAKTTFESLARSSVEGYRHAISITMDSVRSSLFSNEFTNTLNGYHASEVFTRYTQGKSFEDSLRMAQYLDFKTYLPGDILTKVDRASMAHSLEVRVPFLDFRFVEDTAKISTSLKLKNTQSKLILKQALESHLSRDILYRDKMGFAVPLDIWFRDSLKKQIAASVSSERMRQSGLFDNDYLDTIVAQHHSGKRNHSGTLWSLLMFDRFLAKQA